MPTDDPAVAEVADALAELVRKEVPQLLRAGQNWKLVINGSAAGDVSTAIEQHCQRVRRLRVLNEPN